MFFGCLSDAEKMERARNKFNEAKPELQKERQRVYEYAINFTGADLYDQIYQNMNDSIRLWVESDLRLWRYFKDSTLLLCEVDSILCFNTKKDKVITMIHRQSQTYNSVNDSEWYFYGVKIYERWYFFDGAEMVLPREYCQEDVHTPLSFETLKLLAAKYVYKNYLKKNNNGNWEINDRFFEHIANKNRTTSGYGSCFHCKTEDEYYLYLVAENWSERNK